MRLQSQYNPREWGELAQHYSISLCIWDENYIDGQHRNPNMNKKMLENRPEDALVLLVETVEIV